MASGGKRAGAGRKRTEPALKNLRGTSRKDRDLAKVEEAAPAGTMTAPLALGDLEQLHFGTIADLLEAQGRASPHYNAIASILAQRLAQIDRWQAVLEMEGDTFVTANGMVRKRPEVTMVSDAMRQAQSLLSELMLTPSSAQRLLDGHNEESNPFDDF